MPLINPSSLLVNWKEFTGTFSGVTWVKLEQNNVAARVDTVVNPKSGAFYLGPGADGTTTGGNQRGAEAVDLCLTRSGAAQVASGVRSFASGSNTTASGSQSTALGRFATASGGTSTAMGNVTIASGNYSTALGNSTTASGNTSTALGSITTASGDNSTALGKSTIANQTYSTAMGKSTTASGNTSTAMGRTTAASGTYSTAMGNSTTASGNTSTAMGQSTAAGGIRSTAMGDSTTASGTYSTAMGKSSTAQAFASVSIGRFNVLQGSTGSWVATDTLLVAGNGASTGARANALTLLKDGTLTNGGPFENKAFSGQTTTATPTEIFLGGIASQYYVLPAAATFALSYDVIGVAANGDTLRFKVDATIQRLTTAASTVIKGTNTVTVLVQDAGAAAWDAVISADTTNGSPKLTVTGAAATTINWSAVAICSRVG